MIGEKLPDHFYRHFIFLDSKRRYDDQSFHLQVVDVNAIFGLWQVFIRDGITVHQLKEIICK